MAFCHECGSEVTESDTFCPICGIALNNPVLENATEEASEAAEADASASSAAESVPVDEFVDISALRPDSEPEKEAEAEVRGVPDDEFVDISALKNSPNEIWWMPLFH